MHLDKEQIGTKIREARKTLKMTQGDVASSVGILTSNMSRIESGKHGYRVDTLLQICDILQIRITLS